MKIQFLLLLFICFWQPVVFSQSAITELNGNVGINNTSPQYNLDVDGNINFNGFKMGNPRALNIGYSGGNYGGIGYNINYTGSTGDFRRAFVDATSYLEFWNGGFRFLGKPPGTDGMTSSLNLNEYLLINNSGNVSIGTSSIAEKLNVNGDISLITQGRNYKVGSYAHFGETIAGAATVLANNAKVNASDAERVDYATASTDGNNAIVMSYLYGTMFHVKPGGVQKTAGNQWFSVGTGTDEVMRLTPGQNVLIGTTTDDGSARLKVKGTIKAQKIVVTQTGWSDYVFHPNYKLRSLNQVEAFIKKNNRLPDMPSEKEVEAKGISVGDTQALLLRKIEELTLYVIALRKENELQQKQITELRKTRK